ncbi:GTPase [uncultured Abyssibacter sp.]|uniref:GTPase n=1 Tax=uncultured Abyssibacter sp. TaxID=2320202 RepID=UPI0032B1360A
MAPTPARRIRPLFGLGLLCLMLFLLAVLIHALDGLIGLYERARAVSPILPWVLNAVLGLFALGSLTAVVWWMLPVRRRKPRQVDESSLRSRLQSQQDAGIDVTVAVSELDELEARRRAGRVFVALFGETSTGKSSVIRALVPDAEPHTAVTAGTTRDCKRYQWQLPSGEELIVVDAPGFSHDDEDTRLAHQEAIRAHLVVYLCDGDLTRSEWAQVDRLLTFGKPLVIALNKSDLFREDELDAIRQQIAERFHRSQRPTVVGISAGGEERITRIERDGTEREITRPRKPQVQPLRAAIERCLLRDADALTSLRDAAVFQLTDTRLDEAERSHQRRRAEQIIATHTRAAVVGALAALSPGSDIVIQGAIGARLVRSMCQLHDIRVREVDIETVLKNAGSTSRKSSALALAVAGNALKAFPGIGTVTGGLAHAVAYGLLFDAFGHALADSLRRSGMLNPEDINASLEQALDEDLAAGARRIARLALRSHSRDDR